MGGKLAESNSNVVNIYNFKSHEINHTKNRNLNISLNWNVVHLKCASNGPFHPEHY